jgi:DNA-binding PadR family transcriptional regulator
VIPEVMRMAKDNYAQFAVLGLLSHEPMAGYDIRKRITHGMSYFWDLSYGQIYPALKALEKRGFVSKQVQHRPSGPSRKVYSVTGKGLEALRGWLVKPVKKESMRYEILLKLTFGSQVPVEVNLKRIEEFRERSLGNLKMMEVYEEELRGVLDQSPDHLYLLLTVLMGKAVYRSHLEWADKAIGMLKASEEG